MKGTRRIYKQQLKSAEKELDRVYKYYFQADSLAVQLDLENSTIKNELQYLKNKISECKIANDSLAHTASMLVRIEALNKTISSLNDKFKSLRIILVEFIGHQPNIAPFNNTQSFKRPGDKGKG